MNDPFASAPDEPQTAPETAPTEAPEGSGIQVKVTPVVQGAISGSEIVTTFKAGTGYDQPWVVIHAGSVEESDALLDQKFADYLGKVKRVASFFNGGGSAPANNGNVTVNNAPQGATEPPAGSPPCPGDGWVFKTGFKKDGSGAWKGWMPPRGSNEKPVFFN